MTTAVVKSRWRSLWGSAFLLGVSEPALHARQGRLFVPQAVHLGGLPGELHRPCALRRLLPEEPRQAEAHVRQLAGAHVVRLQDAQGVLKALQGLPPLSEVGQRGGALYQTTGANIVLIGIRVLGADRLLRPLE